MAVIHFRLKLNQQFEPALSQSSAAPSSPFTIKQWREQRRCFRLWTAGGAAPSPPSSPPLDISVHQGHEQTVRKVDQNHLRSRVRINFVQHLLLHQEENLSSAGSCPAPPPPSGGEPFICSILPQLQFVHVSKYSKCSNASLNFHQEQRSCWSSASLPPPSLPPASPSVPHPLLSLPHPHRSSNQLFRRS